MAIRSTRSSINFWMRIALTQRNRRRAFMLDHVFRHPSVRNRIRANPLGKWVPENIDYLID